MITPSEHYEFAPKPTQINPDNSTKAKPPVSSIIFSDLTMQSGLFFSHQQGDSHLTGINESLGSGACTLDYDNDGWQDLFIVNGSGQNRFYGKSHWWQKNKTHQLFKNSGSLNFINQTEAAGLKFSSWGMGCIASDFDNDGYSDLFITTIGENQLLKNNGDHTFSKINNFANTSSVSWSNSACAADFNKDGLIDLYIANYIDFNKSKLNYEEMSGFSNNLSEYFNPGLFNPSENKLYKNEGDFKFSDQTEGSQISNISGRSIAVRCHDINNDQLPDILVSNEANSGSNKLYINKGNFIFADASEKYQLQNNNGSRSILIGNIDNQNNDEILITTAIGQNLLLYQNQISEDSPVYYDISRKWNLTDNLSSFHSNWGGGLHDFNQDGFLDLFVLNGFTTPDPDVPKIPLNQPNQLWLNSGVQFNNVNNFIFNFSDAASESSRGSVFSDFDNDGDIDIYITNNNSLGQLLVNTTESNNHWIGIHLIDSSGSLNIVGTKISVISDQGKQTRTVSAGDSFLSDSEDRLLFGLGKAAQVNLLSVTWPNGKVNHFNNPKIDQYLKIDFSNGMIPNQTSPRKLQADSNNYFSNISDNEIILLLNLLNHHKNFDFILPFFEVAVDHPNQLVRKNALIEISKHSYPKSFALLIKGLHDSNETIASISLEKLCSFENESTIRWLVNALNDKRQLIRKEAAHCFKRLYKEEEAMIHRKFLALPALIQLLSDKDSLVKISAIKALAEAEHYRAALPLIKLLNSFNTNTRMEAVRALGRVREKIAIKPLLKQLKNSKEKPEVLAHVLIALKRLGYVNFLPLLNDFFKGQQPFNKITLQTKVDTLNLLIQNNKEGFILVNPNIKELTKILIKQNINNPQIAGLLSILKPEESHNKLLFESLTKSKHVKLRLHGYLSLINYYPKERPSIFKLVENDSSSEVKQILLNRLLNQNSKFSVKSLSPFLKFKETEIATIQLISKNNSQISVDILAQELPSSRHKETILLALKNNPNSQLYLAEPYLKNANFSIKKAAYEFYLYKLLENKRYKKIPDFLKLCLINESDEIRKLALVSISKRKELWAIKETQRIILDKSENDKIRLIMIENFKHPFRDNSALMLKIANDPTDSIQAPIIKLLTQFDTPEVLSFFKNTFLNSSTSNERKILAAKKLSNHDPIWVINTLLNRE